MNIREFQLTIPAGGERIINADGRMLRCTNSSAAFDLAFPNGAGNLTFESGLSLRSADPFKSFTVKNTGGDTLEVSLIVTDGEISDDRANFSASVAIPVNVLSGPRAPLATVGTVAIAGGGSDVSVVAQNDYRRELRIQNVGAVVLILTGGVWLEPFAVFTTIARNAVSARTLGVDAGKLSVWEA